MQRSTLSTASTFRKLTLCATIEVEPIDQECSCQTSAGIGWRARNGTIASATPRGSFSCSAWFAPASMNTSVCGIHSRSLACTSSQPGQIEALSDPKTPSVGCVIRPGVLAS